MVGHGVRGSDVTGGSGRQHVARVPGSSSRGQTHDALTVPLGDNSYAIHLGPGLLPRLGRLAAGCVRSHRGCIVSNRAVARLYGARTLAGLRDGGLDATLVHVPAGERSKCLSQASRLYDEFLRAGLDRASFVVALGGGVVGDLAGFAAATYMRGIDYLQVPTTLMAQVDSSIGGKTAVNLPRGKNLVGAFHQPRLVVADTETLRSLPRREYRNGWAEVVKHALIADADLFAVLEATAGALGRLDPDCVVPAIRRSCEIKVDVVRRDEREAGVRAILNCGHTIGHALERTAAYGRLRHGEAVAIGLAAEARIAVGRGMMAEGDASRLEQLLLALGLPIRLRSPNADAVLAACEVDKKRLAGKNRVPLPLGIGNVAIVDDVTADEIRDAVAHIAH